MPQTQDRAASLHRALVSKLKLRQLGLLIAVQQHRTVSRVATELGISQPAVTKALREVESIFSAALFERTSRGLVPTSVGEAVLALASRWFAELDATTQVVTSIEAGRKGRVRIGLAYGIPQALLSTALRELLGGDFKVAVMTREGTTDELIAALMARELDCAIARSFDGEAPGLVQQALYEQGTCLVMATESAKRVMRRPITLARLSGLNWIMPPANTPMRRTYNAMFVAAGLQPPSPVLEAVYGRSVETVLRMDPNAIAILAKDPAGELTQAGHCTALPFQLSLDQPPVTFLTTTRFEQDPVVHSLRAALVAGGKSLIEGRIKRNPSD